MRGMRNGKRQTSYDLSLIHIFSADGQKWGNPLYAWEVMKADDYAWWKDRLRHAAGLFDKVRIDHFRAFSAYWACLLYTSRCV